VNEYLVYLAEGHVLSDAYNDLIKIADEIDVWANENNVTFRRFISFDDISCAVGFLEAIDIHAVELKLMFPDLLVELLNDRSPPIPARKTLRTRLAQIRDSVDPAVRYKRGT
jgi:hypothetical protein